MPRRTKTPEGYVLDAVLDLLSVERIWHRRMNTGAHVVAATETTKRRFIKFGSKGMADVLATPFLFSRKPVILWIETKWKSKQREAQKEFQAEVEEAGHYYLLARSTDDVIAWLKERKFKGV
jgi:hypothetical protein